MYEYKVFDTRTGEEVVDPSKRYNLDPHTLYEYKVFDTRTGEEVVDPSKRYNLDPDTRKLETINDLLDFVVAEGWEPMDVDYVRNIVFCRRTKRLND